MKNSTLNFGLLVVFSLLVMSSCTKQEILEPTEKKSTDQVVKSNLDDLETTLIAYKSPLDDPNSVVIYDPNKEYPIEFQSVIEKLQPLNRALTVEEYLKKGSSSDHSEGITSPCDETRESKTVLTPLHDSGSEVSFRIRTELYHVNEYETKSQLYDQVLGQVIDEDVKFTNEYTYESKVLGRDSRQYGNGYSVLRAMYYCPTARKWLVTSSDWYWH